MATIHVNPSLPEATARMFCPDFLALSAITAEKELSSVLKDLLINSLMH